MEEQKIPKFGDKTAVYEGKAKMTSGKLTKDDLTLNRNGKVVSKKSQARGFALISQLRNPAAEELKERSKPAEAKDLTVSNIEKPKPRRVKRRQEQPPEVTEV